MTGKSLAASTSRHDEQPTPWFWCKTCSRIFPEKDKLAVHKREVHPEELTSPTKELLWNRNKELHSPELKSKKNLLVERTPSSETLKITNVLTEEPVGKKIQAFERTASAVEQPKIPVVTEGEIHTQKTLEQSESSPLGKSLLSNRHSSEKKNIVVSSKAMKPTDDHCGVLTILKGASIAPSAIEAVVTNATVETEGQKLTPGDTTAGALSKPSPGALPPGKRGFACPICGLKFQRTKDKLQHFAETHGDRPNYKCEDCSAGFSSERALDRHKASHLKYSCVECYRKFDEKTEYDEHLKLHESKSRLKSNPTTSLQEQSQQLGLVKEAKQSSGLRPVGVQLAGQSQERELSSTIMTEYSGTERKNELHRGKPIIEKVQKATSSAGASAHKAMPFACDQCSSTFTASASLKTHMNIHTGAKPYGCRFCPISFQSTSARHKHEFMHKMRYQQCRKCYKLFTTAKIADSHLCSADAQSQEETPKSSGVQQADKSSKTRSKSLALKKIIVTSRQGNGRTPSASKRPQITEETTRSKQSLVRRPPVSTPNSLKQPVSSGKPKVVLCFGSPGEIVKKGIDSSQQKNNRAEFGDKRLSRQVSSPKPKIRRGRVQKAKAGSPGWKLLKCGHCGKTFGNPLILQKHERNHIRDKLMQTAALVKSNSNEQADPALTTSSRLPKPKEGFDSARPTSSTCQNQQIGIGVRKTIGGITISPVLKSKAPKIIPKAKVEKEQNTNEDGETCLGSELFVKLDEPIDDMHFQCTECSRLFKRLQAAKIHVLVHTGERPHKCYFCEKTFRQYAHRYSHVKSVHKDESFNCKCGDKFLELKELRKHMQQCSSADPDDYRVPTQSQVLPVPVPKAPTLKLQTATPTISVSKQRMPVLSKAVSSKRSKTETTLDAPYEKLLKRNSIYQQMQKNSDQTPSPEKGYTSSNGQSQLPLSSTSRVTPTKSLKNQTLDRNSLSPQILPSKSTSSQATTLRISAKKPSAAILPPISMKKVFQCPVCDVRFFEQPLYDKHMEWHRMLFSQQPKKK